MAFENDSTAHQILQRLEALEKQVAYLSQALGNPSQSGFDAQPAPIGPLQPTQAAPAGPGPVGVEQQVVMLAQSGNKIEAIRLYRQLTNCDLRTAKAFVDQF